MHIPEELILQLQNSRRCWIEATDRLKVALGKARTTFNYGELEPLFDEVRGCEVEYQSIREKIRLLLLN